MGSVVPITTLEGDMWTYVDITYLHLHFVEMCIVDLLIFSCRKAILFLQDFCDTGCPAYRYVTGWLVCLRLWLHRAMAGS